MPKAIRIEHLDNGLTFEFYDRSNRYFGDYHRVCVEVCCRVPVSLGLFGSAADLQAAKALLGDEVTYARRLEKMGVSGGAVGPTRDSLIQNFLHSSLTYLGTAGFPRKFIASELARVRKDQRPHWPRI